MTEYKSEVKTIGAPLENVYAKLSDLTNLGVIQSNLDNPELLATLQDAAPHA